MPRRILAVTGGDPAGIGPEIALRALLESADAADCVPLLVVERVALEALRAEVLPFDRDRLIGLGRVDRAELERVPAGSIALLDPIAESRPIGFGTSGPADAAAALAAVDAAVDLARRGVVDAIVTAPVSKESIARHVRPRFRGHTEYLAAAFGLERYGRDHLMAFLSPRLQVALLSVHEPLRVAIESLSSERIEQALGCLERHAGGRIAVAGLNPHAGEGGLLGEEDARIVAPAVARARDAGIDVAGPESPDSLFARARGGEFDWVLALYHDQGLIAVKSAEFGRATNWTLGLPVVRTSVDHGTAFALAGTGRADAAPMRAVLETTRALLEGRLPRGSKAS